METSRERRLVTLQRPLPSRAGGFRDWTNAASADRRSVRDATTKLSADDLNIPMLRYAGDFVLAIDQGTSNTKAIVIDRQAKIVAKASVPMEIAFPQPGWVEQDPLAIWKAVQTVVDGCLEPSLFGQTHRRSEFPISARQSLRGIARADNRLDRL